MRIERERSRPFGGRVRGAIATAAVWTAVAIGFGPGTGTARAGDAPPFTARAGEDLARAAALTWADDARLVYVESDAPLTPEGAAAR